MNPLKKYYITLTTFLSSMTVGVFISPKKILYTLYSIEKFPYHFAKKWELRFYGLEYIGKD